MSGVRLEQRFNAATDKLCICWTHCRVVSIEYILRDWYPDRLKDILLIHLFVKNAVEFKAVVSPRIVDDSRLIDGHFEADFIVINFISLKVTRGICRRANAEEDIDC